MNKTAEAGATALTPEWLEVQYRTHATTLLRLAVLLTHARAAAEDIVHDAFVSLHRRGQAPACVVRHYRAETTDAGIAEALGISAGSVMSHLHRARASLAGHPEDLR